MRRVAVRSLALLALMCVSLQASALDPRTKLVQFDHYSWTAEDSAPDTVNSFAHTEDGRLWLGSASGVWKFDGEIFQLLSAFSRGAPGWSVSAMVPAERDGVWLGFEKGGISLYTDENLISFGEASGLPPGSIRRIVRDQQQVVWAATEQGLAKYDGRRWARFPLFGLGFNDVLGLHVDSRDRLWIATATSVLRVDRERKECRVMFEVPPVARARYFAEQSNGDVWLTGQHLGVVRFDAASDRMSQWFATRTFGAMLFDRDGTLWLAGDGLSRLVPRERRFDFDEREAERRLDRMSQADGLSHDMVLALFEDRQGNVWASTRNGLDRFTSVASVPMTKPARLSSWEGLVLVPDGDSLYVAARGGPALLRYEGGELVSSRGAPVFTAGARGLDGSVWFGGPSGVSRVDVEDMELVPLPEGALGRDVLAMVLDGDNLLWVSIEGVGMYVWDGGHWKQFSGALPKRSALSAMRGGDGALWFGYPDSTVARVVRGDVKVFEAPSDVVVGEVVALSASGNSVWLGGDLGLARFDGNTFMRMRAQNCQPFAGVSGLATHAAVTDVLWVFRTSGLSAMRNKWLENPNPEKEVLAPCSTHRRASGLRNSAQQSPRPAFAFTSDGFVWMATVGGLSRATFSDLRDLHLTNADEKKVDAAPRAVLNWVRGVSTGKKTVFYPDIAPGPSPTATFPPHTRDFYFNFASTELTVPTNARFRFRLLGYEKAWRQSSSSVRDFVYTNLGPGEYVLEIAASRDGTNFQRIPTTFAFEILPAFYQTTWFRGFCVLCSLLAIAMAYRWQLAKANGRIAERLQERTRERERIARELHDTLLQGVQALILRIHSAMRRIGPNDPVRGLIEEALDRAEEVLVEGRDRVTDLRDSARPDTPLDRAIAGIGERVAKEANVSFRHRVSGEERVLHPIVKEEVCLIAREALVNAATHSRARSIEANVSFEKAILRVTIDDDGTGIDTEILNHGRPGHWGLRGMRERAVRIGADLKILARPGGGTLVSLRVPTDVAYRAGKHAKHSEHLKGNEQIQ